MVFYPRSNATVDIIPDHHRISDAEIIACESG